MNGSHLEVRISRGAFRDNILAIKQHVRGARVCVVLKSDAYGHGLAVMAREAADAGADRLGIISNEDARVVRRAGIMLPLLRLRVAFAQELDEGAALDIEEQLGTLTAARAMSALAARCGRPVRVHLNVDTGMGRTGFLDVAEARRACGLSGLELVGVMTHFSTADSAEFDGARRQRDAFDRFVDALGTSCPAGVMRHTHNSAAAVRWPEGAGDMVRVGAACFGMRTSTEYENLPGLQPVMSLHTRVLELRDVPKGRTLGYGAAFRTARPMRIASLPIGFGDGYPRAFDHGGEVLIRGVRCSLLERVSLNVMLADVTDVPAPVEPGDPVVVVGRSGDEEISFESVADRFGGVHTQINLAAGVLGDRRYVD